MGSEKKKKDKEGVVMRKGKVSPPQQWKLFCVAAFVKNAVSFVWLTPVEKEKKTDTEGKNSPICFVLIWSREAAAEKNAKTTDIYIDANMCRHSLTATHAHTDTVNHGGFLCSQIQRCIPNTHTHAHECGWYLRNTKASHKAFSVVKPDRCPFACCPTEPESINDNYRDTQTLTHTHTHTHARTHSDIPSDTGRHIHS